MFNTPDNPVSPHQSLLAKRHSRWSWQAWHLDPYLLLGLAVLSLLGLFILYSASNQNISMVLQQISRLAIAFAVMFVLAQIPPHRYQQWAPWIYLISVIFLVLVLLVGQWDHGARRWLGVGSVRFQPSEVMKISLPMMLAYYLNDHPLPPNIFTSIKTAILFVIPVLLTAREPDLGTAIVILGAGLFILLLAGMSWKLISGLLGLAILSAPILWHFMHPYQRARVLTLLDPERDPLGAGYHIIQSKIAIGSGGFWGKGYLQGTQSRLQFLPTHTTDFIFSVSGEEWGFIGSIILLTLFVLVLARVLYISAHAQNTFGRLLAGSLGFTFFLSMYINMGMVTGILPVVGIPLPLISYGGTSMLSMMAGFGIIMSMQTHRKLWSS